MFFAAYIEFERETNNPHSTAEQIYWQFIYLTLTNNYFTVEFLELVWHWVSDVILHQQWTGIKWTIVHFDHKLISHLTAHILFYDKNLSVRSEIEPMSKAFFADFPLMLAKVANKFLLKLKIVYFTICWPRSKIFLFRWISTMILS